MSVTPRTSHREISLLKRERPSNMLAIDFAELVSHMLRSLPVNSHVPEHLKRRSNRSTLATSQLEIDWLN